MSRYKIVVEVKSVHEHEEAIIAQLDAVTTKINDLKKSRFELQKVLDEVQEKVKRVEMKIYSEVSGEVDADGKKAFTNDKLREAETAERFWSNQDAIESRYLLRTASEGLKLCDLETELYEMKYKNLHARVRLLSSDRLVTVLKL